MSNPAKIIRWINERADHKLLPFHKEFIRGAFAPGVEIAALSCPRGQAKTWLFAQMALCSLVESGPLYVRGLETLMVSASLEQSRVLVGFLRQVLGDDPHYSFVDSSQRLQVKNKSTGARFRVLSSSGKRAMGLANFTRIFGDEPGAWEARSGQLLWDALRTSLGKLPNQSVLLAGTRSPAAVGSWWPELLDGESSPGKFVQLLSAAPSSPWDKWETIRKANPMALSNPNLKKTILRERDEARKKESLRPSFEAYRLNRMVDVSENPLVSIEDWQAVEAREAPAREGRPIVGLDLGSSRAWSAAWALWRNGRSEAYALAPGVPDLKSRERQDCMPAGLYTALAASGVLLVDEGRRVSRPKKLVEHLQAVGIRPEISFCDRFAIESLRDAVGGRFPIQARVTRWSEATQDIASFRSFVKDGPLSLVPECVPLARLGMSQASVENDRQGSVRLRKRRTGRSRDDVAVAGVLACGGLARSLSRPATTWRYRGTVAGSRSSMRMTA